MTMLPTSAVRYWPMYGDWTPRQRRKRAANPYAFHRSKYLRELEREAARRNSVDIAWANIDVDAIRLEFWNRAFTKRPTWFLT